MLKNKIRYFIFSVVFIFAMMPVLKISAHETIQITVNDSNIPLEQQQQPIIENNRVLVPLRAVFEFLGAQVDWEEDSQEITCKKGLTQITLTVGSLTANVNGKETGLELPAKIINGCTFVPVRFVAEGMDCFVGWQESTKTVYISDEKPTRGFDVHFLDVGQADCILIKLPNGQNMLIDAGNNSDGIFVTEYIKSQGITILDFVVGTHPHADHIGGLSDVINAFDIGMVFMPKVSHTSKTFQDLLIAIKNKGLPIHNAKAGVNIINTNGLKADIIAPVEQTYSSLNNYSAVIKITYLNNVFLFMGDAERLSESQIAEDIKSDVLKVGHHGSDTSTSPEFLNKVLPEYAVISVGKGNSYGHPSPTVLALLDGVRAKVFRTDEDGEIIMSSNGNVINVRLSKTTPALQGGKTGS